MDNRKYDAFSKYILKIDKAVYTLDKWLAILFIFALVAVLFINVMCRYVLFIPSAWSEEAGRYLFVWVVYLGSAAAMYRWEHIDINLIDSIIAKAFSPKPQLAQRILTVIKKLAVVITIIYLVFLCNEYGKYLAQTAKIGTKAMFLPLKLTVPMSSLYVCGILMIFHALCYLLIPEKVWQEDAQK